MRYLKQLDGLRAFAVGSVLVEHFAGEKINRLLPIGAGDVGVSLFFTMSGFLITGILIKSFDGNSSKTTAWRQFYLRRLLRLTPLLVAAVSVFALLGLRPIAESWLWHITYLSNFYIAFGGEKTVFWSLAVEEQFYLLWPFVIAFAPRRHLVWICIALFMAGTGWRVFGSWWGIPQVTTNVMLPGSFAPLGAGCLVAVLSYRNGQPAQMDWATSKVLRRIGSVALASLLAVLSISLMFGKSSYMHFIVNSSAMAIVYAWVVASAARGFSGVVKSILENAIVVYVGRISYGIYVIHNFIPQVCEKLFGPLPKVAAAPIVLALTFAIAAISFRYFESPIRALGHRIQRRGSAQEAGTGDHSAHRS